MSSLERGAGLGEAGAGLLDQFQELVGQSRGYEFAFHHWLSFSRDGAPEEESEGKEMSESEAFEAQGRAHAALKAAKSRAATIRSVMAESSRSLDEASRLVSQFLQNPLVRSSTGVPLAAHLKDQLQAASADASRAAGLVDELVEQTQRIQEMEGEIAQF